MTVTMTATANANALAANPPIAADGRMPLAGADRSAWTCPIFYLAIPACIMLVIAVLAIRLFSGLGDMLR